MYEEWKTTRFSQKYNQSLYDEFVKANPKIAPGGIHDKNET